MSAQKRSPLTLQRCYVSGAKYSLKEVQSRCKILILSRYEIKARHATIGTHITFGRGMQSLILNSAG